MESVITSALDTLKEVTKEAPKEVVVALMFIVAVTAIVTIDNKGGE